MISRTIRGRLIEGQEVVHLAPKTGITPTRLVEVGRTPLRRQFTGRQKDLFGPKVPLRAHVETCRDNLSRSHAWA